MSVRPSVCPSVRPSVRSSVRPSVIPTHSITPYPPNRPCGMRHTFCSAMPRNHIRLYLQFAARQFKCEHITARLQAKMENCSPIIKMRAASRQQTNMSLFMLWASTGAAPNPTTKRMRRINTYYRIFTRARIKQCEIPISRTTACSKVSGRTYTKK